MAMTMTELKTTRTAVQTRSLAQVTDCFYMIDTYVSHWRSWHCLSLRFVFAPRPDETVTCTHECRVSLSVITGLQVLCGFPSPLLALCRVLPSLPRSDA